MQASKRVEKEINNMKNHTDKYEFCNHYHEITKEQKMIDLGSGKFVADKVAIPLLKALNEIGLETRTHHVDKDRGFIGIMIDNVQIEIRKVFERSAKRTKYNNRYHLLISWDRKPNLKIKKKSR